MAEQLALDLEPQTFEEHLAAHRAYVRSRTPAAPYDPAEAPIPF